jgi:RND family efflux transporter MFP subunit
MAVNVVVKHASAAASVETAPVAAVASRERHIWAEGRVVARPGAEVRVTPEIGGKIASLSLHVKGPVKKGDTVCELASDDHRAALAEAKARIAEADEEIARLEAELSRAVKLHAADLLTAQALERTQHDLSRAQAHRATGLAAVERAQILCTKTRILAPIDGVVVSISARPGETVAISAPLATIVDLASVRVDAEVDELDLGGLEVGAPASIAAEGDARKIHGRVEELPDTIGPRSLDHEGPGEPQGTRVLLAKVAVDGAKSLRLGQRVEVEIELPPGPEKPAAPPVIAPAPPELLTGGAQKALGYASAGVTACALLLSRKKRAPRLGARRIVKVGDDGLLLDRDTVLSEHETERGRARVELAGASLELRALSSRGVEARPFTRHMAIEGVSVDDRVSLVHGMVFTFEDETFVYLDRAASLTEQERVWTEEVSGDSIADVWDEDDLYVIDDSEES